MGAATVQEQRETIERLRIQLKDLAQEPLPGRTNQFIRWAQHNLEQALFQIELHERRPARLAHDGNQRQHGVNDGR